MGKKKSSGSKKQQSLAAAVKAAEEQVDEITLGSDIKSETADKKGDLKNEKKGKSEAVEEFEFDYTGGENMEENNDEDSVCKGLCVLLYDLYRINLFVTLNNSSNNLYDIIFFRCWTILSNIYTLSENFSDFISSEVFSLH